MEDMLQKIIDDVENNLTEYRNVMSFVKSHVCTELIIDVNSKNERSVASYITYQLQKTLIKNGFANVNVVNELDIRSIKKISSQDAEDILNEVEGASAPNPLKKKFIPDSFAYFEKDNVKYYLFVEYKINDYFKYIQLANDYIKFKQYTKQTQTPVLFAYVLLKPNASDLLISLANHAGAQPKYQILSKIISVTGIDKNASVFLYTGSGDRVAIEIDDVVEISEQLQKGISNIYEIPSINDFSAIRDYEENLFYKNAGKFGSRVLTASRIRKKYREIRILYDAIRGNAAKIPVPSDAFIHQDYFKSEVQVEESFYSSVSLYFNYQIAHITKDDAQKINNAEFSYAKKRALWILILMQKFANDMNINLDMIYCYDEEEEKDTKPILQKLNEIYHGETLANFNQLVLGLVYYIVHLYSVLFVIENEQVMYSDDYLAFKNKKYIISTLKKLEKGIGLSSRSIAWNVDLLAEGDRILQHLIG